MKRGSHFLRPRQQVIFDWTRRLLDETGQNANSFAMSVAERYVALVAQDVRTVPFRLGDGDDLIAAMKANGQTLRRYMDGTVKTLPADLEDAWVLSLPEPYRSGCERELGLRRGLLPVALADSDEVPDAALLGELMEKFGRLFRAMTPALADGVLDKNDRPHAQAMLTCAHDLLASVVQVVRAVRGILPGNDRHG